MRHLIISACLWGWFIFYSFSQINISFDSDCLKHNSAIVSKAMIEALGEDSIKHLLDNNAHIVFICNVDSLGHILEIVKINSKQKLQNNFVHVIESYLVINGIRFFICYRQEPLDMNKCKVIDSERKQFKNNHSRLIASIAFPGELMSLYEYEKEKNIRLSKYDYLLLQINEYLTEDQKVSSRMIEFEDKGAPIGCLPKYHYYLQDYLGNNRDVLRPDGGANWTVVQRNEYTPFGVSFPQTVGGAAAQPYKFGGKELDRMHGLDFYDFHARQYDPWGNGFPTADPLAEKRPWESPYCVMGNNPVNRIDPTGMIWTDINGNEISDENKGDIQVYIFYDPNDFSNQSMKMAQAAEKLYGEGTVAMSNVMTESEFAEDWGNMAGTSIKEVNLNYHGSNQQIHLDWKTDEYIVSTENGKTSALKRSGTDIKDLPKPSGNIDNAILNVNTCHSTDRNDKDMPLVGAKLTVAESFRKYTNFQTVKGTSGAVNYNSNGQPTTQWYYGSFWNYLGRPAPIKEVTIPIYYQRGHK